MPSEDELRAEAELDQLWAENVKLRAALAAVEGERDAARGAMRAADERLRAAAVRVWGDDPHGCDAAEWMADEVLALRSERDALRGSCDPFNGDSPAYCGTCHAPMSCVRPGKHQCDFCAERDALRLALGQLVTAVKEDRVQQRHVTQADAALGTPAETNDGGKRQ
jgi:hypothetical protein